MRGPILDKLLQEAKEAHRTNAPQRLPQVRPRALSCPLPLDQRLDQRQSALIAHLPSEIRQLIWIEVLGGHLLHIVRAPKRLLAIECIENFGPELNTGEHICWGCTDGRQYLRTIPGFYIGPQMQHRAKAANLLPLLQVCRIVYTEAISILYANNIFDINHLDTFVYLQQTVLPERLNRIRILNFTWDFKVFTTVEPAAAYGIASWSDVCDMLSSLTHLQELTVHLEGGVSAKFDHRPSNRTAYLRKRWKEVLDMLTCITAVKKFNVFMPWTEDECAEVAKGCAYPFRLAPEVEAPYNSGPWDRELNFAI